MKFRIFFFYSCYYFFQIQNLFYLDGLHSFCLYFYKQSFHTFCSNRRKKILKKEKQTIFTQFAFSLVKNSDILQLLFTSFIHKFIHNFYSHASFTWILQNKCHTNKFTTHFVYCVSYSETNQTEISALLLLTKLSENESENS